MDMNMTNIYNFIDSQEEQAMRLWENLVRIESWSQDVGRVNQVAAHLDTYFSAMGLNTRKYILKMPVPAWQHSTGRQSFRGSLCWRIWIRSISQAASETISSAVMGNMFTDRALTTAKAALPLRFL